jgi:CRISPR system Cascade subunit CasD
MTTLVLHLAGPLQSWGAGEVNRRWTRRHPTKAGLVGLLAAAQGRPRDADLTDLTRLRYGVRIDQPGRLLVDYHTVSRHDGSRLPRAIDGRPATRKTHTIITRRHYLTDAVFLAAIEGDDDQLRTLDACLRAPEFPLYLGRRSCPPALPPSRGLRDSTLTATLTIEPWQAAPWHQRRHREPTITLPIIVDDPNGEDTLPDLPLTFDSRTRAYTTRRIHHDTVTIRNLEQPATPDPHDPFELLED